MLISAEAPNAADWMQGWGAIISLPLTLLAVLFTGRLLMHEIRMRREERTELEGRQARLVRVTVNPELDEETATFSFTIKNLSSAPIYDINVLSYYRGEYSIIESGSPALSLNAGGEVQVPVGPNWHDRGDRFVPMSSRAVLQFQDADGRTRIRFDDEEPRRWIGPSMVSYQSNCALLFEYLGTFPPLRWLFNSRSRLRMEIRASLERRIQARRFPEK